MTPCENCPRVYKCPTSRVCAEYRCWVYEQWYKIRKAFGVI